MNKVLKSLETLGFEIHEYRKEFEIVNPSDVETGTVVLDPKDNFMSWQRTECSHWGPFENLDDDQQVQLVTNKIVGVLGAVRHPPTSSNQ
jgi:hypothetical protein